MPRRDVALSHARAAKHLLLGALGWESVRKVADFGAEVGALSAWEAQREARRRARVVPRAQCLGFLSRVMSGHRGGQPLRDWRSAPGA